MPDTLSSAGRTTPPGPPAAKNQLTVAQAVVKFLGAQYSESDGDEQKLFAGCFGIFGHGNVTGIGQALLQAELEEPETLPYTPGEFAEAIKAAKAADHSIVIYVETDPLIGAPDSESWWDVPVSETSTLGSTQQARTTYDEHKATQKLYL